MQWKKENTVSIAPTGLKEDGLFFVCLFACLLIQRKQEQRNSTEKWRKFANSYLMDF